MDVKIDQKFLEEHDRQEAAGNITSDFSGEVTKTKNSKGRNVAFLAEEEVKGEPTFDYSKNRAVSGLTADPTPKSTMSVNKKGMPSLNDVSQIGKLSSGKEEKKELSEFMGRMESVD